MKYTDPAHIKEVKITEVPKKGGPQSGYGSEIPTRYMVKYLGRWRRVYSMQYANSGSLWIRVALPVGDLLIDADTEYRLENLKEQ